MDITSFIPSQRQAISTFSASGGLRLGAVRIIEGYELLLHHLRYIMAGENYLISSGVLPYSYEKDLNAFL